MQTHIPVPADQVTQQPSKIPQPVAPFAGEYEGAGIDTRSVTARPVQLRQKRGSSPQAQQGPQAQRMVSLSGRSRPRQTGAVETLAQRKESSESLAAQGNRDESRAKPTHTGLPNPLKAGIESLSGMSMDHVRVNYNSDRPAQLNALAYAQGNEIHVAPGQEKHLPHEAWHVVQQAQGRVRPTTQLKAGVPVNDDAGLENEAEVMGVRALEAGQLVRQAKEGKSERIGFEGPVANPAAQLRGVTLQRQTIQFGGKQSTMKETYHSFDASNGEYHYVKDNGLINVFTEFEDDRIGYAAYSFTDVEQLAGPGGADDPYTKKMVLGRTAGKVCHLHQIMNLSLTREGPANIYRGFGNRLMQMVEQAAKEAGCLLIYLEPATSEVRKDPNNNEKELADPTGFYVNKHGFSYDAAATLHNATVVERMYTGMNLDPEQIEKQKKPYNLGQLEGMLTKPLV